MARRFITAILFATLSQLVFGQSETYIIKKAFFSSEKYDEFSPVYYNNGIVFCANRSIGLSKRSNDENKGLFKIFYIDSTEKKDAESSRLLSKNLTTILNDGPVTFTKNRDTIYFSRNQDITGKLSDIGSPRNKLGIYSAVFLDGQWTKVRDVRINNEWYNVTTPCLAPGGKRLYFASDKSGGYGGSDLYYSERKGDRWEDPVNLGPVINTKGNESYPFVNVNGELFFSSDGHQGFGGKDIFFSFYGDSTWHEPVRLDKPINSDHDDFGIITDPLMKEGYFSTNRDKTIDIYHFRTKSPQVLYDKLQKEYQYCFMLDDSGAIAIDSLHLKYVWSFGDGSKEEGRIVKHCFPGTGKYTVRLDIFDKQLNKLFFTKSMYSFEILELKQPYINSSSLVVKGEAVNFDGLKSSLPGYTIQSYFWNFRDGTKGSGAQLIHAFKKTGEYMVNMELVVKNISTGEIHKTGISRKVKVFDDSREIPSYLSKLASSATPELREGQNTKVRTLYSAEAEFRKDAVYNVELVSAHTKIGVNSGVFNNVPSKYTVMEMYNPEDSTYSYIIDQQINLMATYPAYLEMYRLGFKNARIKGIVLKDPADKELHNLVRINGVGSDSYFDSSDKLTSNAYIMLDQIIKLMNRYPTIKIEVSVHTDNQVPPQASLVLTQAHAASLVNYMINRGISSKRLVATGYGSSLPIASNELEKDRKLNRRIEFKIIN